MRDIVSVKIVRLLLALSVSIWLAGGCLFGCGNMAIAAKITAETNQPAIEGESCHAIHSQAGRAQVSHAQAARSHDCCAKPKPKAAKQRQVNVNLKQTLAGVSSLPPGGMSECPLMIGATAAVSKSSSNSPDLVGTTAMAVSLPVSDPQLIHKHSFDPFLPNRGPTYLRCCVFLI